MNGVPEANLENLHQLPFNVIQHECTLSPNTVLLGKYTITKELGSSQNPVFLATINGTDQKVAIKGVPRVKKSSTIIQDDMYPLIEGVTGMIMENKRLMRIYAIHVFLDKFVYIMQAVQGTTLHQLIKQQQVDDLDYDEMEETVCEYAHRTLLALTYMHRNRLCHRDLKTANILIDDITKDIVVVDYGLVTRTSDLGIKDVNLVCGTPNCFSPEIVAGNSYHGEEVDLWCWAVMVFVLIFGRWPFPETSKLDFNASPAEAYALFQKSFPHDDNGLACLKKIMMTCETPFSEDDADRILDEKISYSLRNILEQIFTPSFAIRKDQRFQLTAEGLLRHTWFDYHGHRFKNHVKDVMDFDKGFISKVKLPKKLNRGNDAEWAWWVELCSSQEFHALVADLGALVEPPQPQQNDAQLQQQQQNPFANDVCLWGCPLSVFYTLGLVDEKHNLHPASQHIAGLLPYLLQHPNANDIVLELINTVKCKQPIPLLPPDQAQQRPLAPPPGFGIQPAVAPQRPLAPPPGFEYAPDIPLQRPLAPPPGFGIQPAIAPQRPLAPPPGFEYAPDIPLQRPLAAPPGFGPLTNTFVPSAPPSRDLPRPPARLGHLKQNRNTQFEFKSQPQSQSNSDEDSFNDCSAFSSLIGTPATSTPATSTPATSTPLRNPIPVRAQKERYPGFNIIPTMDENEKTAADDKVTASTSVSQISAQSEVSQQNSIAQKGDLNKVSANVAPIQPFLATVAAIYRDIAPDNDINEMEEMSIDEMFRKASAPIEPSIQTRAITSYKPASVNVVNEMEEISIDEIPLDQVLAHDHPSAMVLVPVSEANVTVDDDVNVNDSGVDLEMESTMDKPLPKIPKRSPHKWMQNLKTSLKKWF